jgi:hypothetical protein
LCVGTLRQSIDLYVAVEDAPTRGGAHDALVNLVALTLLVIELKRAVKI